MIIERAGQSARRHAVSGRTPAPMSSVAARSASALPSGAPEATPQGDRAGALHVVDDPEELARFTRWEPAVDGRQPVGVSALQLSGMHCAACVGIIEDALMAEPGVLEAQVSAASQRATVRWDSGRTRASRLLAAVRGAGYGAVPDAAASARQLRRDEHRFIVWRLFVASFLAMQVMMMATPSYVAGPGELAPDLAQLLNWGSWVLSIPVIWFGGMPFLRGAWQSLRARRIGMDVPVALGIAVAFVASTGATFQPGGPFGHEVYFDSLTMFIAFLWLGRWLEQRVRHRTAEALEAALTGMPRTALRVSPDGQVDEVPLARLQRGDCVRVPIGDTVPADGILLSPSAGVGEAFLTGESMPVAKRAGDTLLAGSRNVAAALELRVERVGADTRYEAIVALMREALSQRPSVARLADRVAGPFLWAVLALAAGSALAWLWIDPSRAIWIAVAVLIVTCPCALSLATPATLVAAAGGLAQRGVLLRRLEVLETAGRVQQLFVDKTGTLTSDRPQWSATRRLADGEWLRDDAQALSWAAELARWSSHPLSRALVEAQERDQARASRAALAPAQWSDVQETPGQGLQARDAAGRVWRLGSATWTGAAADGLSPVFLACEGRVVAAFDFEEELREDAAQALRALHAEGVRCTLLSGDSEARARALAARLGIADVVAAAGPEQKLQTLRAAQAASPGVPVAMVGDGINDAPVLAAADVSLAMGHGALAAQDSADAVIASGRAMALVDLRRTSARSMRIVRQNLAWAAVYNAACIPLAMIGWLPPWAAGLGMAMSSLGVILNAQRASRASDRAAV